ncbi:ferritin-like metal-binding protein YciE [Paraburkholderia youngii]
MSGIPRYQTEANQMRRDGRTCRGGRRADWEIEKGPVLDLALIGAAQRLNEIATYGTLAALAEQLGESAAQKLLLDTLEEAKSADEKLTVLGQGTSVEEAATQ